MIRNASQNSYADDRRVAWTVRLPREMHNRMRKLAIDRECRVNDLYQALLETYLTEKLPGEPFLQAPPTSAVPITLWLDRSFSERLRQVLDVRCLTATNMVVTALLYQFGEGDPSSPNRDALIAAA